MNSFIHVVCVVFFIIVNICVIHIAIDPELISMDHAQAGSKPEKPLCKQTDTLHTEKIHSTTLNVQPKSSQSYTYMGFLICIGSGTQLVGW